MDAWSLCKENKWGLTPFIFLLSVPALAAFDVNGIGLGATEKQLQQKFPQANCRALEWPSQAADRRCDDSRLKLGFVNGSVTFYLKRGVVEGYDLRFDKRDIEAVKKVLVAREGQPVKVTEGDQTVIEWESGRERARLTAEKGRRRASVLVWRGAFEQEIYKIR